MQKIRASEQTINWCARVNFSICPKIRSKQYFHEEFLVEIQGEQRQCPWSLHSPAQCKPLECSGGSSAWGCPCQQIILMQNKHRTNVWYKIAVKMKSNKPTNSTEKPADSELSQPTQIYVVWLYCWWLWFQFQKFLLPIVMVKEAFQKREDQYFCRQKQTFLLYYCSPFLDTTPP